MRKTIIALTFTFMLAGCADKMLIMEQTPGSWKVHCTSEPSKVIAELPIDVTNNAKSMEEGDAPVTLDQDMSLKGINAAIEACEKQLSKFWLF